MPILFHPRPTLAAPDVTLSEERRLQAELELARAFGGEHRLLKLRATLRKLVGHVVEHARTSYPGSIFSDLYDALFSQRPDALRDYLRRLESNLAEGNLLDLDFRELELQALEDEYLKSRLAKLGDLEDKYEEYLGRTPDFDPQVAYKRLERLAEILTCRNQLYQEAIDRKIALADAKSDRFAPRPVPAAPAAAPERRAA